MPSITSFNLAHVHLLLNHVPTVGAVVVLGLLIVAFIRRDEALKLVGLEVLFAIALLTLPAYMTGVAAFTKLREPAGVSEAAIRVHQDVALSGFTWMECAGFFAWLALWQARRHGRAARGLVADVDRVVIGRSPLMARAANLGGDIRHPELGGAAVLRSLWRTFLASKISDVMVNSPWAWPASETVHFLGFRSRSACCWPINLRILGAMKQRAVCGRPSPAAVGHAGLRRSISSPGCCSSSGSRSSTSTARRSTGRSSS